MYTVYSTYFKGVCKLKEDDSKKLWFISHDSNLTGHMIHDLNDLYEEFQGSGDVKFSKFYISATCFLPAVVVGTITIIQYV